jgi:hypothetical protein
VSGSRQAAMTQPPPSTTTGRPLMARFRSRGEHNQKKSRSSPNEVRLQPPRSR